jgi:hypothetical protein
MKAGLDWAVWRQGDWNMDEKSGSRKTGLLGINGDNPYERYSKANYSKTSAS